MHKIFDHDSFLEGKIVRKIPSLPLGIVTTALLLFFLVRRYFKAQLYAPTVGFPGTPDILSRFRFHQHATTVIYEGYQKFKGSRYRLLKNDGDLIVLSNKYAEELRALPDSQISAIEAHITNLVGKYSSVDILLESNLHTHTISSRLTPSIGRILPRVVDELDYAFQKEMPKCDNQWVSLNLYSIILRLVARASARIFVGEELCRNEDWLDTSITYTRNVFETVLLLKAFPSFLHPVLSLFLPSYWRLSRQLKLAKTLLVPIIDVRRKAEAAGNPDYTKEDDFLQWMMDLASSRDGQPGKLAHRQLIMSLASIHTTTMAAVHVLYDLMMHPEYIEPLRNEIRVNVCDGWKNLTKPQLSQMKLLDSFMKESQRINPPTHLSFLRMVKQDMRLSDGTFLPKGTQICMPSGPISLDSECVPNADEFDGFRWASKTSEQFVSTSPNSLHFGYGKYACPGRFFASNEIKVILSRLLLDYNVKFGPAQSERPKNVMMEEKMMPNSDVEVFFRRRGKDS